MPGITLGLRIIWMLDAGRPWCSYIVAVEYQVGQLNWPPSPTYLNFISYRALV